MRKPTYTKIFNLLAEQEKLYIHATDNEVFIADGHILVRVPDWMYRTEFLERDANSWPGSFPAVYPGECTTYDNLEIKEEGPDLHKMWCTFFDRACGRPARLLEPMKHKGRKVQVFETRYDKVILNYKFYDAVRQATQTAAVYAGIRREPVWFYDDCEIWRSCFSAMVMPVNYSELEGPTGAILRKGGKTA